MKGRTMMDSKAAPTVLVVGATGTIGRLAVAEALAEAYAVRALVRDAAAARRRLPPQAQLVTGELTSAASLADAVAGVDAVIFTHGGHGAGSAEAVDYGAVRNVLVALAGRPAHLVLMTAIGVTRQTEAHDWKRRGERLVRASGMPYTIVRPGWFDYNDDDQQRLVLLQGDRRHAGDPRDGVVARAQLAQVLVRSIASPAAVCKTFELVAEQGAARRDFDALFASAQPDRAGALDGVRDLDNLPLDAEPARVREDLQALGAQAVPAAR
jgi:uncharacterized protein YbjT (DUF2867 family)